MAGFPSDSAIAASGSGRVGPDGGDHGTTPRGLELGARRSVPAGV